MKFGVVVFPGSNCDEDMVYTLKTQLNQEVVKLWHKDTSLQNCDFIVLPGGFSYGDYLRSGAIARFSPIMENVVNHAKNGGFVLGVCNGFQILCEAGLVPGTLMHNNSRKFICKNTYITAVNNNTPITSTLVPGKALQIPIAHGEGKYFVDEKTLSDMNKNGQIIFKYCNKSGVIDSESNPNGTLENIAGVCNSKKNVFGMMPHPERAADAYLNNTDGLEIFNSLIKSLIHS